MKDCLVIVIVYIYIYIYIYIWKAFLKIYLDLVFGKLVCCKGRRGFEDKIPPWGFESDLEILPV
jgi:hypothetical protein